MTLAEATSLGEMIYDEMTFAEATSFGEVFTGAPFEVCTAASEVDEADDSADEDSVD